MLPVPYLALLVGFGLLVSDLRGGLRIERHRLRWWKGIAALATLFVGLQPAVFGLRNPDSVAYPFPVIAAAYLGSALVYLAGIVAGERSSGLWLRRIGYAILLVLGTLPSFLLLFLAPVIAVAGIGLARPTRR